MYASRAFGIGALCVAAALASSTAFAQSSLLSTDSRYAAQADEKAVSGGGTASASELLPHGLRLAAPDAKGDKDKAHATAIYRFKVPLAATSFYIEAAYRADAQASDKQTAGFLFVRNSRAPIEPENRPRPRKGDAFAPGDLYALKGSETSASVTVPFDGRVLDGILEVRLIAEAGQAFDAQYVQVASHRAVGGQARTEGYRVPQVPSGRAYDPLNYDLRPPLAGYGVPNLYPNLYGAGHATSQDPIFWSQVWQMQRPHLYYLYPYPYPYPHHGGHRHKSSK